MLYISETCVRHRCCKRITAYKHSILAAKMPLRQNGDMLTPYAVGQLILGGPFANL